MILKRVPVNFDYPLNTVWYPYYFSDMNFCVIPAQSDDSRKCFACRSAARHLGISIGEYGCPEMDEHFLPLLSAFKEACEPPKGPGYQVWETVSEGSPVSPVFENLDDLCKWCSQNLKTWNSTMCCEEWKELLTKSIT